MSDRINIREACRRAVGLDGSDAQALEGALSMTERERDAEKARADDLSRTVAGMADALECLVDEQNGPPLLGRHEATWNAAMNAARAILSRPDVAAERGRWRKVDDVIAALTKAGLALGIHSTMDLDAHIKRVREDFDAAIARAEASDAAARALGDDFTRVLRECADLKARADEKEVEAHFNARACEDNQRLIATAERARDELGIQLAAQGERLRLAEYVIATLRIEGGSDASADVEALRRWDAVPGDALADRLAPAKAQHAAHVDARIKHGDGVDETIHHLTREEMLALVRTFATEAQMVGVDSWIAKRALPPSPAGVSGWPGGSTPAASSVTPSDLEVVANPSAHRGTHDIDAIVDAHHRVLDALEASGIDTDNVCMCAEFSGRCPRHNNVKGGE